MRTRFAYSHRGRQHNEPHWSTGRVIKAPPKKKTSSASKSGNTLRKSVPHSAEVYAKKPFFASYQHFQPKIPRKAALAHAIDGARQRRANPFRSRGDIAVLPSPISQGPPPPLSAPPRCFSGDVTLCWINPTRGILSPLLMRKCAPGGSGTLVG